MDKPQEELKLNKGDQDCTLSTSPQANNDKEVPSSDKKILKELVCKACNRLIVPPIFITTIEFKE
ncbi:hypothetical protein NQ318_002642 [Aromia moschata]|uniref:Uncharacterized protein n=1 Tax=Aromia moschata TaxID=1265417 RepID=A0AAV8YA01_9CUCU|nr:hypothetical protein NQ318_002642 [Aromia moschata]